MTTFVTVTPRDPVVARDGRPFGLASGRRMKSLAWPYPSVVAGSLRTAVGKALGRNFDAALQTQLKAVEVAGPFPVSDGRLFLPAPADALVVGEGCVAARPLAGTGGCDLPPGLRPVCPPESAAGKFGRAPAWWSADHLGDWLAEKLPPDRALADPTNFRDEAAIDERTHLELDAATFAAKDGQLFASQGVVLDRLTTATRAADATLALRVRAGALTATVAPLDAVHPVGGERRLARFTADGSPAVWACPPAVRAALAGFQPSGVRMALASPAVFAGGWRPGWLDAATLTGSPPGCAGVTLKLVGLTNARWKAVSGWSYETHSPKAIRRVVPAGAVYFFEVVSGSAAVLADRWLEPVSDDEQDRRDGFGVAAWGVWTTGGA